MLKKLLALALVVVFSGSLFGCAGENAGTDGDVAEVRIWTNSSHSKAVMEKLVNKWNETEGKEKGIKIAYEVREGDRDKDIDIAMSAGNAPEMFGYLSKAHALDGKIIALDDIEGMQEIMDKYPDDLFRGFTIEGKRYALPFSASTRGLIYNKDMFKEAGLVDENGEAKPPETWDEVVEYAKILTNESENKYGIVFPMKWGTWFTSDVTSPGYSSVGYDGYNPVTGEYDYSGYKPIMEAIMQMKADKSYYPGAEGLDNDPARARFAEGNIGMKFAFSWDVAVLNDQFPAKCDWGVAPYPVVDKEDKYLQLMSVNGDMVINKEAAEKVGLDKVLEVYKWYHSDEVITELYRNCMELPVLTEQILNNELVTEKKGWKEFSDMVDISNSGHLKMPSETSGQESIASLFINKVWPGDASIDEIIEQYNKTMNDGIVKYKELHPETNSEQYINKDWNIKR